MEYLESADLKPIISFIENNFVSYDKKSVALENIKKLVEYLSNKDITLNYEDASELLSSSLKLLGTINIIIDNNIELEGSNDSIENIFIAYDLSKKIDDNQINTYSSNYYQTNSKSKDLDLMKLYLESLPPLLTPEEEKKYAYLANMGNSEAKKKLIECNLRLVISIAKRYINKGVALSDLIQEGNIGLIEAVNRFDYSRGTRLSTYATWWIRQSIKRTISSTSKTIRIPDHTFDALNKMIAVEKRLTVDLKRTPTDIELAKELDISLDKLHNLKECKIDTVSLSAPINNQDSEQEELGNFIEDKTTNIEDEVLREEYLKEFKKAILNCKSIDERQREILFLRFGIDIEKPYKLEEVSKKFGLTRERIRQIETKAIRCLAHDRNIKKFKVSDSTEDMIFPITYYVPKNIYRNDSNSYSRTKKFYK